MRFVVGMIPALEGVHPSALITPVGQDRLILTVYRPPAGDPELQSDERTPHLP